MSVLIILGVLDFIAQRICPRCRRPLEKRDPMIKVICVGCGWVWK